MIDQSLKTASVVATAEGKVTDERSDNRTSLPTKLRERYYVINLLYDYTVLNFSIEKCFYILDI